MNKIILQIILFNIFKHINQKKNYIMRGLESKEDHAFKDWMLLDKKILTWPEIETWIEGRYIFFPKFQFIGQSREKEKGKKNQMYVRNILQVKEANFCNQAGHQSIVGQIIQSLCSQTKVVALIPNGSLDQSLQFQFNSLLCWPKKSLILGHGIHAENLVFIYMCVHA